ncbi:MAG TPA: hypothetical protein VHO06_06575 [Polyangia bacterium]|nr:hypothetical protein [Polyangia bacterium]
MRVTGHSLLLFSLAAGFFTGCGGSGATLPPVQVESAHFRYHAESATEVQSDILERLERSRADVLAYLGRQEDDVIDYYLFADHDAYTAATPCGSETYGCETGHSIFSNDVMSEHELIHAYTRDIGLPPIPIVEGTAEAIGCLRQGVSDTAEDWQSAVANYPPPEPVYGTSRRLVRALLDTHGIAQFTDYYAQSVYTWDPALFALQYQQFWGTSFAPLWNEVNAEGSPPPARCPCMADPISPDGTTVAVIHPNASDYRPIAAGTQTVLLTFSTNTFVGIQDCSRETTDAQLLSLQSAPASVALLRLDPPAQYFLDFELAASSSAGQGATTDAFTATAGVEVEQTCTTATPLVLGANVTQLTVAVPRAPSGVTWYVPLSLSGSTMLYRDDSAPTSLNVCADCASACSPLDGFGSAVPANGQAVLQISPGASQSPTGLVTVVLSLGSSGSIVF